MSSGRFIRNIRILILLLVLLFVAINTRLIKLRTTDWDDSLWVTIYPINGDANTAVQAYIDSLNETDFESIEQFMAREARRYGEEIQEPITIKLAPEVAERPPKPPTDGSVMATMWWSLHMRYWAYRHNTYTGPNPDIQIFVVYHDPSLHQRVDHSLGLQKGLIGVVNAFAHHQDADRNNIVITHELLHTLGANDRYNPETNAPLFPLGYADPEQFPLYPQRRAELMAGRIPISAQQSRMPAHFREVMIGPFTAREIRWLE